MKTIDTKRKVVYKYHKIGIYLEVFSTYTASVNGETLVDGAGSVRTFGNEDKAYRAAQKEIDGKKEPVEIITSTKSSAGTYKGYEIGIHYYKGGWSKLYRPNSQRPYAASLNGMFLKNKAGVTKTFGHRRTAYSAVKKHIDEKGAE